MAGFLSCSWMGSYSVLGLRIWDFFLLFTAAGNQCDSYSVTLLPTWNSPLSHLWLCKTHRNRPTLVSEQGWASGRKNWQKAEFVETRRNRALPKQLCTKQLILALFLSSPGRHTASGRERSEFVSVLGWVEKKSGVLSVVCHTQGFIGRKLPRGLLYLLSWLQRRRLPFVTSENPPSESSRSNCRFSKPSQERAAKAYRALKVWQALCHMLYLSWWTETSRSSGSEPLKAVAILALQRRNPRHRKVR